MELFWSGGWLTFKGMRYPKLDYIKSLLEFTFPELEAIVQKAFILGSFARGTENVDSDLDVALIVDPEEVTAMLDELDILDIDSLNAELLNIRADTGWEWEGRPLDLQVYSANDPRLKNYSKIPLKASSLARLG
jgi:predicted nucleotidyltransferase